MYGLTHILSNFLSSPLLLIILNILFWPVVQLSVSWIALRRPDTSFGENEELYRPRNWETKSDLYRRFFRVTAWKKKLPDGGAWFSKTFRKDRLYGRDSTYLRKFRIETCRGEWAHWVMLACTPVCFFWNPVWAAIAMVAYALMANIPCILVQRHNRLVLDRILKKI